MGSTGCILLLAAIAGVVVGEMKEQVLYGLPFSSEGICVRFLNGTHQFGCGSSMNGDEGVLVYARARADLEGVSDGWKERFPDYEGGFVVLMKESLFDRSTAPLLMSSARVSGVLLIPSKDHEKIDQDAPLSTEAACPNRQSSLYSDWRACGSTPATQWNGQGAMLEQGLRFTDWAKPMTRLLNSSVLSTMITCHDKYNLPTEDAREGRHTTEGRLCAVSMKTFMQGTGSSVECTRRQGESVLSVLGLRALRLCEPMESQNVFAIVPPGVQNKTAGGGYLAVIVRMDAVALIPDATPATMGTMSAVVAALTAAKVVGDNLAAFEAASKKSDKRIIFAFLHGESFDYVGSSRWVYDMEREQFPLRKRAEDHQDVPEFIALERISLAVELQQIDGSTQLHAHVDGRNYEGDGKGQIKKALETMSTAIGDNVDTSRVNAEGVLPPSSLHSILKKNRQVPSLLLTSFGDQYSNRRLHSSFDRLTGGKKEEIAVRESMETVSKGVFAMLAEHVGIDESQRSSLKIDSEWLEMLSGCFIASSRIPECDYLRKLWTSDNHPIDPIERSTFVTAGDHPGLSTLIQQSIAELLTISTGEHNSTTNVRSRESCKHTNDKQALYNFKWQFDPWKNDSYCCRTSVYSSEAKSPAFMLDQNDVVSPEGSNYSTWTQSHMAHQGDYQLFLVESRPIDWIMMIAGLLTTLIALLIVGRCDDSSLIVDEGERAAEDGEPL